MVARSPPSWVAMGMGVTRLVAAVLEQNHDDSGICWPAPLAPYDVHLIALNYGKSEDVQRVSDELYTACQLAGLEVLFDERDERPGVKFADADLIGLPQRIVVGDRGIKNGIVEYKRRSDSSPTDVEIDAVVAHLKE